MGELTLALLAVTAAWYVRPGCLRSAGRKLRRTWIITTAVGIALTALAASGMGERAVGMLARLLMEVRGG